MKDNNIIDFLKDNKSQYLINCNSKLDKIKKLENDDFCLYHIEELTFEQKSPRKEALENVLSSLRLDKINFVYLIVGDKRGVHFYFGICENLHKDISQNLEIDVYDIGEDILKPSIQGNFRGSKVSKLNNLDRKIIKEKINDMNYFGVVEGVPGINEDNENFQGVDRLVDVMLGDEFIVSVMASPLNREEIIEIEKNLYEAYSKMYPLSKNTVQNAVNEGSSKNSGTTTNNSLTTGSNTGESKTEGSGINEGYSETTSSSKTEGSGTSEGRSDTTGKSNTDTTGSTKNGSSTSTSQSVAESINEGKTNNSSTSTNESKTETVGNQTSRGTSSNKSLSTSTGSSKSTTVGDSKSFGESISKGSSTTNTTEYVDRESQEWLKYLDEVIIKRLDYGKSKGMFITSTFIGTKQKSSLIKLGNTIKSLYSGVEGNKVPLEFFQVNNESYIDMYKNFQIPIWNVKNHNEIIPRSVISQYMTENKLRFGNWVSTNELSLIAGLPQKEIVGLSLKEEVEFGLNYKDNIKQENQINLGKLIQSGNELDIDVYLDKENLNKHTFITGVTGSGKTTTCQKILIDSNLPFMVIEPAKTEYRILTTNYDDVLIFTLGKDNLAPFRINPFEFFEHENISSRVDMIKACIEASFDMEAAIPQIIESAIYECYEDYGWNISSNKNYKFKDPFADGVYAFPTLSDLIVKIEKVVNIQGFDDRLKNDYIGSIKARLQGLTIGSKGLMLNTKRSVNFKDLVNKRVIFELEEIKNGNEKSLVMGFILINLNEAIKANFNENPKFRHITLVEEAHRLLSKYEAGDSLNKKQGVEVFADMLAEVRKYGESLIIADQIPGKLTPEVLKNTNTKIVHKIFAQDDKEAIGNTIALKDEQKEFMSSLDVGRAIVFSQGWDKAIQVKINRVTNTTSENIISESLIRENCMKYYQQTYKNGVIEGLQRLDEIPSIEFINEYLEFIGEGIFLKEFANLMKTMSSNISLYDYFNRYKNLNKEIVFSYLSNINHDKSLKEEKEVFLRELIYGILAGRYEVENKTKINRELKLKIKQL